MPNRIRKAIAVRKSTKVSTAEQSASPLIGKKKSSPLGLLFSSALVADDTGQHTLDLP